MTPTEIFIFIGLITFVVLVIFLVIAILQLIKTMKSMQGFIDEMGPQTIDLIKKANSISSDTEEKLKKLNPVFSAFSNLGEGFERQTFMFKEKQVYQVPKAHFESKESDVILDLTQLAVAAVNLWMDFKKKD